MAKKSQFTVASQKKMAKLVSLEELEEGARCTTTEDLHVWENRMVEKYNLKVK